MAGPYAAAAVVLAAGGLLKASRPAPTVGALRGVGLPGKPWLVRLLGALEVGVGAAALALDAPAAAAMVAVSYVAFAGFVAVALRRAAMVGSCGCFGQADTPPTVTHLVINVAAAAVAVAVWARAPGASFATVVAQQPLFGIPFALLCAICAGLVYLAFTRLAQLKELRRRP